MLTTFLDLLKQAEAVVVTTPAVEDVESDSPAKPPKAGVARRMQFETAAPTQEADNQIVRLTCNSGSELLCVKLTEEGISNGRFDPKTQEFQVFDDEGSQVGVRLLVNGQALCPPEGFEKFKGPHFIVIQEGGSSTELYLHSLNTRAAAVSDQRSCADNGAYRTSEIVEVPASLADHPDFYEVMEKLLRATLTLEDRGSDQGEF